MLRWLNENHHSITALAAIVIGVAALFVAWDQARIMRRSEHAAMLPIVSVDHEFGYSTDRASYQLVIKNKGVGPALIRSGRITGGGVATMEEFAAALMPRIEGARSYSSNTPDDVTLAVGESRTLLSIVWSGDNLDQRQFSSLVPFADSHDYEVCFCSVFDSCWIASTSEPPAPSNRCSAASLAPPL